MTSGHVDESLKNKTSFNEYGICKRCRNKIRRDCSFGDPLKVKVKGYDIALRKEEAEDIVVDLSEEK